MKLGRKGVKIMNCKNCGAPVPDGTGFCSNCGAKVEVAQQPAAQQPVQQPNPQQPIPPQQGQQQPFQQPFQQAQAVPNQAFYQGQAQPFPQPNGMPEQPPKKKKTGLIILIIVLVVLIVGGAVVGTIFLLKNKDKDDKDKTKGDSAESTVSAYYDAILNGDVDAMMSLVPDNYLDYMIETYDIDEDAVKDELQTLMEDELADWEEDYGANIELTVKCNDEEVAEQSEIDDLNDELEESGWDFTITEGYTYSVDVTFNGDDDEYTETYDDVAVLKVDGKWFNSDAMSMITDAATEAYYNS